MPIKTRSRRPRRPAGTDEKQRSDLSDIPLWNKVQKLKQKRVQAEKKLKQKLDWHVLLIGHFQQEQRSIQRPHGLPLGGHISRLDSVNNQVLIPT